MVVSFRKAARYPRLVNAASYLLSYSAVHLRIPFGRDWQAHCEMGVQVAATDGDSGVPAESGRGRHSQRDETIIEALSAISISARYGGPANSEWLPRKALVDKRLGPRRVARHTVP